MSPKQVSAWGWAFAAVSTCWMAGLGATNHPWAALAVFVVTWLVVSLRAMKRAEDGDDDDL